MLSALLLLQAWIALIVVTAAEPLAAVAGSTAEFTDPNIAYQEFDSIDDNTDAVLPIFFVGGMGASALSATLNKDPDQSPHWFCSTTGEYNIWLSMTNLLPGKVDCWLDNFRVRWTHSEIDAALDNETVSNGIHVTPKGGGVLVHPLGIDSDEPDPDGGFVKTLFSSLANAAEEAVPGGYKTIGGKQPKSKVGVQELKSLFKSYRIGTLHYDWRLGPNEWVQDGTFEKARKKIERFVKKMGKPAIVVSLSEGGNFFYNFLTKYIGGASKSKTMAFPASSASGAAWKSRFIHSWFSLSTPFAGTAELTRVAFYPDPLDFYHLPQLLPYLGVRALRKTSLTFVSTLIGQPRYLEEEEVLIETPDKKYTVGQLGEALRDAGHDEAAEIFEARLPHLSLHDSPGVKLHCIFGRPEEESIAGEALSGAARRSGRSLTNNTIASHFVFANGLDSSATSAKAEPGDTVVPSRSLEACVGRPGWDDVESLAVPGATHGSILRDERVLEAFKKVVKEGNAQATKADSRKVYKNFGQRSEVEMLSNVNSRADALGKLQAEEVGVII